MRIQAILAGVAICALATAASAQTTATAVTDLNIRSGPGPQHPIVGYIAASGQVSVTGCMEGSKWCTVSGPSGEGWAYSDYLVADYSGTQVVMTERYAEIGVPVTVYDGGGAGVGGATGVTTGVAGGVVAGALVAGPVGAAVGGVLGATAGGIGGAAAGAVIDPPTEVRTYVTTNQVQPVYLDGEVVVGAALPPTVQLAPIPEYQYQYVYLNGQPVLVEPASRQIVYVVR
jgi:uncharacterized protein YraI